MIYYLPLEPYEERYTKQLMGWTVDRMKAWNLPHQVVLGDATGNHVTTGVVLDAHGRGIYAATQTARLLALLRDDGATSADIIFIEDMFHPGYEAIPYLLHQLPAERRPRVYARNYAQSVDPNDFTFPMRRWMRHYEQMVSETASGIFVASTVLKEMSLAGWVTGAPVHCVGLPFDGHEVRARAGVIGPKQDRVLFAARWDREKQPDFYMELVRRASVHPSLCHIEFAVCTSAPTLRSNDPALVTEARRMAADGLLHIYEGLTKEQYYQLLGSSLVLFNCALQDFVSYTLLEASALGTAPLYPSWLSFPEALGSSERNLYVAWSLTDAMSKLMRLVHRPHLLPHVADYHTGTIDRTLEVMLHG